MSGIIHCAALKSVDESIEKRNEYMEANFHATVSILETAKQVNVKFFIFCSSAAVYGSPNAEGPIKESDPTNPMSPYGETKLLAENAVQSFLSETGANGSSFRFFNVIGTASFELSDNSKGNLVPIVMNKLKNEERPIIYGNDYPTADGTCVRDYVDVRDLAIAIVHASKYVEKLPPALNIGAGREASVLEVISTVISIQKVDVIPILGERRLGNPARLCAGISLAKNIELCAEVLTC